MDHPENVLCDRVESLLTLYPPSSKRRIIIAMAGGPGSGKSTISAALAKLFNARNSEKMRVVPMVSRTGFFGLSNQFNGLQDGFHYSKAQLSTLKHPECLFRRRGAPFTFDGPSFIQLVHSLRSSTVTETDHPALGIWAPSFDHAVKDPVADDIYISSSQRIILLEGSYLLLNEKPWDQIRDFVDESYVSALPEECSRWLANALSSWFIDVSREEAKKRLVQRHIQAGIENNWDDAVRRVESNDLLNLDLVIEKQGSSHIVVSNSRGWN